MNGAKQILDQVKKSLKERPVATAILVEPFGKWLVLFSR
jgi:hypothetical protein